jgi:hypothetical protein
VTNMSEKVEERIKKAAEEGLRELDDRREATAQKIVLQIEEERERDLKHGRRKMDEK